MFHMEHIAANISCQSMFVYELSRFVQRIVAVKTFESVLSKIHGIRASICTFIAREAVK